MNRLKHKKWWQSLLHLTPKPGLRKKVTNREKYKSSEWFSVDHHSYYVCVRCGNESGEAMSEFSQALLKAKMGYYSLEPEWPESVPMHHCQCSHGELPNGSEAIAKVEKVSSDGQKLIVSYVKCNLCDAKFLGPVSYCPVCHRKIDCMYEVIGRGNDTVYYLFQRFNE